MLQAQMRSKKFMLSAEVAELIMEMRGNSIGDDGREPQPLLVKKGKALIFS